MMKNGLCPKCGAATIYSKTEGLKYAVAKGVVFIHTGRLTVPSSAVAYICTSCGYFENYIDDPAKLSQVARTWQMVPPPGQQS